MLIYLEGEVDVITIVAEDMMSVECHRGFLRDNIIDFYIK